MLCDSKQSPIDRHVLPFVIQYVQHAFVVCHQLQSHYVQLQPLQYAMKLCHSMQS